MEQIYRRRGEYAQPRSRSREPQTAAYKQALIKQAVLCLILFVAALLIKVYPQPELAAAKADIGLILDTNTDFYAIPHQVAEWFYANVLHKDAPQNVKGGDVLTAMTLPVDGSVSSDFGLRTHPADGSEKFHYGVDIAAPEGEKIKCAARGEAVEVGESADYGNYILVRHDEDIYTLYAHCQTVLPQTGDSIEAGQVIATVGATGNATGPHLHFEIRSGNTWLNPADFITLSQES